MEAFEFATAGRVLVGAGRSADLPALLAACGTRALVCTGASPDRHAELLAGLGMPAALFPVAGEPTVDLVRTAVAAAREHGADVVAAIGGGSVIDTGKAAAMLLGNGGDPLDYLEVIGAGRAITRPSVPFIAVPTAASGMDALTQCLEPFVSPMANPLTDAVAREGIRRAAAGLRRAYADGSDLSARADMSVASVAGGMALANAK